MDLLCLTALALIGLAKGLNYVQDSKAQKDHDARMAALRGERDANEPDVLDERHL